MRGDLFVFGARDFFFELSRLVDAEQFRRVEYGIDHLVIGNQISEGFNWDRADIGANQLEGCNAGKAILLPDNAVALGNDE